MYPYLYFLGHKFLWYDVLVHLSVAAAMVYLYFALTSIPLKKSQVLGSLAIGGLVQYYGGKVLPSLYYLFVVHNPKIAGSVWTHFGGRYFHSVFFSTLLYTLLVCKVWRWPMWKVLDRWLIGVFLASAIARIGCLLHGCCKGKPCDLPWAIHLPPQMEIARHPVQAYMIILETILWVLLWRFSKKSRWDGQVFWLGIFMYSIYRFSIEFLRINPAFFYGLTHAQLVSVFGVLVSAGALLFWTKKNAWRHEK